jgi:hypothetical protein
MTEQNSTPSSTGHESAAGAGADDAGREPGVPSVSADGLLDQVRRLLRRRGVQVAGAIAGGALLIAAVGVVLASPEPREALRAAASGHPLLLLLLPLLVLGNVLATAMVFQSLLRRHGSVGRLEMAELMAASTLLNFVPLRPGLLGRIGWHATMNGIPASRSVRSIVEAILIGAACLAAIVLTVLLMPEVHPLVRGIVAAMATFAPWAVSITVPSWRIYSAAAFYRAVDLLVWAARYLICFQLIGAPIGPDGALAIAAIASAASLIPLAGNGLGLREWTTGLLAPLLAGVRLDAGLAADLLNRGAEILTMIPAGVVAIAALLRRAHRRRRSAGERAA